MFKNRLLLVGLSVSLAAHIALIIVLSIKRMQLKPQPVQKIDIVYKQVKTFEAETRPKELKKVDLIKDKVKPPHDVEILSKDKTVFDSFDVKNNEVDKFSKKISIETKGNKQLEFSDRNHRIDVMMLNTEKITNPSYLSYRDIVREKIRKRLFDLTNENSENPQLKRGELVVTFILTRDGQLQQVKILDEKTQANDYLKEIVVESIKSQNPYGIFPKNFDYPELTFSISIIFRLNKMDTGN